MSEKNAAIWIWAGFLFWMGMAAQMYTGNRGGALLLAVAGVAAVLLLGLARAFMAPRPPKEKRRRSDLPEYDFDDIKPSDFE